MACAMKKYRLSPGVPMLMVSLLCSIIFFSCRKDSTAPKNDDNNNTGGGTASSTTDEDSLKYLMYRIMQVTYADGGRNASNGLPTYYWYNQVPGLDPFSTNYSTAEQLLSTIDQLPAGERPENRPIQLPGPHRLPWPTSCRTA